MGLKTYDMPLKHKNSKQRKGREETKCFHHSGFIEQKNTFELVLTCRSDTLVDKFLILTARTH